MPGKGYVGLDLDMDQAREINKLFKIAGVDCLTPSEFHVTVMQDESNPDIDLLTNDKKYTAKVVGVERLGKPGGDWEAIVLILDSPEIQQRYKELCNAGFNHKFDDLKCHMSIVYKPKDTDEDLINLVFNLGVLPEELTFGNERLKVTI